MEKLSPEDISRAREMALPLAVELTPFEPGDDPYKRNVAEIQQDIANAMLAYSAAENERLTQELEQERAKTDVELEDRAEAAEAKCDRLKGALLRLAKLVEDGVLVRNTNDDATLGSFVEQAVRLTRVLKETQEALA